MLLVLSAMVVDAVFGRLQGRYYPRFDGGTCSRAMLRA